MPPACEAAFSRVDKGVQLLDTLSSKVRRRSARRRVIPGTGENLLPAAAAHAKHSLNVRCPTAVGQVGGEWAGHAHLAEPATGNRLKILPIGVRLA